MVIECSDRRCLYGIRFTVRGNLRFLSHSETVSMFMRAFARAGIKLVHSQGFNPRPRISLPLPRAVGVESDCELSVFEVDAEGGFGYAEFIRESLGKEMPEGIEIQEVFSRDGRKAPQPRSASYRFMLCEDVDVEEVCGRVDEVMESEELVFERRSDSKKKNKRVDVRGFIKDVRVFGGEVTVTSAISNKGTVRVDEIMELLGIEQGMLSEAVRRTHVEYA